MYENDGDPPPNKKKKMFPLILFYVDQIEIEEAKNQEITRLQSALGETKVHAQGNSAPEAPTKVTEQVSSAASEKLPLTPTIDVSGIDNELVQRLAAENEKLKVTYEVCFNYILVQYMFHNS